MGNELIGELCDITWGMVPRWRWLRGSQGHFRRGGRNKDEGGYGGGLEMPHAQVMIAAGACIDKSGTDLASDSMSSDHCTISPRNGQTSCASAKGHAKLSLQRNKSDDVATQDLILSLLFNFLTSIQIICALYTGRSLQKAPFEPSKHAAHPVVPSQLLQAESFPRWQTPCCPGDG